MNLDKAAFQQAYDEIADLYKRNSELIAPLSVEPFNSCWAAERHRQFWKPSRLRLVLLAESHVYTDEDDFEAQIRSELLPASARNSPREFVRLIYCLGYGENRLLTKQPTQSSRGTPPFWNLFADCLGSPRVRASNKNTLDSKVRILDALKENGIWLADASIHACMNPRYPQKSRQRNISNYPTFYGKVLAASWKYVRSTVADAESIWMVGKMARDYLPVDPLIDREKWVYQRPPASNRADHLRRLNQLRGESLRLQEFQ